VRHREALQPILERTLAARDRAGWTAAFGKAGVPCGEVRHVGETLADPQLEARGMIASMRHTSAGAIRLVNSPIRLSEQRRRTPSAPPTLGEHTEAVLMTELGLTPDDVRDLREREVI
jgi:formyl-CoA transferase